MSKFIASLIARKRTLSFNARASCAHRPRAYATRRCAVLPPRMCVVSLRSVSDSMVLQERGKKILTNCFVWCNKYSWVNKRDNRYSRPHGKSSLRDESSPTSFFDSQNTSARSWTSSSYRRTINNTYRLREAVYGGWKWYYSLPLFLFSVFSFF